MSKHIKGRLEGPPSSLTSTCCIPKAGTGTNRRTVCAEALEGGHQLLGDEIRLHGLCKLAQVLRGCSTHHGRVVRAQGLEHLPAPTRSLRGWVRASGGGRRQLQQTACSTVCTRSWAVHGRDQRLVVEPVLMGLQSSRLVTAELRRTRVGVTLSRNARRMSIMWHHTGRPSNRENPMSQCQTKTQSWRADAGTNPPPHPLTNTHTHSHTRQSMFSKADLSCWRTADEAFT